MASAREREPETNGGGEDAEGGRSLKRPLLISAAFAAGAGAALAAKSALESRRKADASAPGGEGSSGEDLVTTLRRAAMDVAIAATNQAAERLSVGEQSGAERREPAEQG